MKNDTIAVLGFLIMSGIAIYFMFANSFVLSLRVLTSAEDIAANVTKVEEKVYANSGQNAGYYVYYDFTLGGKRYNGNGPVDAKPGKTVIVAYLPDAPQKNGVVMREMACFGLAMFSIMAIIFGACLFWLWRAFRNRKPSPITPP